MRFSNVGVSHGARLSRGHGWGRMWGDVGARAEGWDAQDGPCFLFPSAWWQQNVERIKACGMKTKLFGIVFWVQF